ncbi:sigma-54-dependent Fis family transcriptional regulator [Psychrobacter sp. F1192]|uniref:Sigma-54-dependent Fis family transcriptional regulator n=1 Tax=Psychrobacter coccoides TaxID=2818440 RepID=A0ABS3NRD9_9GAMM|nr:sigma-54 dependent transcriptional regulator [Psychrobacter coccoides]MBO1531796.1 sigma-54-dependent Fis family transcriptional regulator [Psychrobacter coccoides]
MAATALVVDDEVDLCRLMQITLTKMGIKSDVAYTLSQAKSYWDDNDYDFCLTDLKLPDGSGLDLVKHINRHSDTPVAVITAHGSMDLAIEALKLGAFDFVNKPLELPRLRQLVENALKVVQQDNATQTSDERTPEQDLLDSRLIGDSTVMQALKKTIVKLARSQAPVFLSGASGTGKEVVARLIHDLSPRRDGSFVPVNCGAIPSELMESEFFGHKKGSFTGAVTDKQGLFQQANGGTLFLDEVADLPLAMQVKLLRAIQEKTVRAIGDTKETPVDIRILSATHKDLNNLVKCGDFRQDLYYRINVIELKLPTLKARRDDIPVLSEYFLAQIASEWQLDLPPQLTDTARQRLQAHEFSGNVRELRNILERAITLAETSVIDSEHLGLPPLSDDTAPQHNTESDAAVRDSRQSPVMASDQAHNSTRYTTSNLHPYRTHNQQYNISAIQASSAHATHIKQPSSSHNDDNQRSSSPDRSEVALPKQGLEAYLQEQEKQLIIQALEETEGNKTQAAELLGTTFRSLRYRMKKLEIDED